MNENLTYHREGDYLLPNVVPPKDPQIGVWGLRRKNYLLKNKKPIYTGMLLSGKLNAHLEDVDHTANEMLDQLVGEMAKRLYSLGVDLEMARDRLKKLVAQGVPYDSKEMKDAYQEFTELDHLWKELEKQHLELRDEIVGG